MIKELWKDRTFKIILAIFIISKILVLISGYAGYFFIPEENSFRKDVTNNPITNPWAQFDGRAYLDIAENGYNSEFENGLGNYGFYPLYPVLIKIFFFIGYDLAAFLLANIFSFFSLVMLYLLIKKEFGEKVTKESIFYILFFPTAYFFSVMYAESLFFFLSLLTFYFARQNNYLFTGISGFLLSLCRMQGVLIFIPVLYLYLKNKNFKIANIKPNFLYLLLIPLGTIIFLFYLYLLTGNPFIQFSVLSGHGKDFTMPWTTIFNEVKVLFESNLLKNYFYHGFNIFLAITFIIFSLISFKFLDKDYSLYFLLNAFFPLFSSNLEAISRYYLTIFPAFITFSLIGQKYHKLGILIKILYIVFIIALVVLTIRHVNMHLDVYGL